jgi:hypothetical protein
MILTAISEQERSTSTGSRRWFWGFAAVAFAAGMAALGGVTWISFQSVAMVDDQTVWVAHVQHLILGVAAGSAFFFGVGAALLMRSFERTGQTKVTGGVPDRAIELAAVTAA